jgi:predicted esterase
MTRAGMAGGVLLAAAVALSGQTLPRPGFRPPIAHGHNHRVRVLGPSRLDSSFALPGTTRAEYDPTQLTYYLYVPLTYRHSRPHPLVLFVSAKAVPDEFVGWDVVCRKHNVLFALVPGGNDFPPAGRLQLALDVLDDIRRRMHVETARIYVGGFSEGARTACAVAHAYPEFVGGVIAVGGAGPQRTEPWLRDRARELLSVALVAGELDPARAELQRYRLPVLEGGGVRSRLWLVPRAGHAMPPAAVLEEALLWLEAARPARLALALRYPTSLVAPGVVPLPETWARGVVQEARLRLKDARTRDTGLMQLEGVTQRWPGTSAANEAKKLLGEQPWEKVRDRVQQEYYFREAAALDAYLGGPLSPRDLPNKALLLRSSQQLWQEVVRYGAETKEGRQAAQRLEELRKLSPER